MVHEFLGGRDDASAEGWNGGSERCIVLYATVAAFDALLCHELVSCYSRTIKLTSDFFSGKEVNKTTNPDEAVAYGATVQAAVLSGDTFEKTHNLLFSTSFPLRSVLRPQVVS
jgi:hypothetical protein